MDSVSTESFSPRGFSEFTGVRSKKLSLQKQILSLHNLFHCGFEKEQEPCVIPGFSYV